MAWQKLSRTSLPWLVVLGSQSGQKVGNPLYLGCTVQQQPPPTWPQGGFPIPKPDYVLFLSHEEGGQELLARYPCWLVGVEDSLQETNESLGVCGGNCGF